MNLSDVFSKVTYKVLAPVDLPHGPTHQHEINGVSQLCNFFDFEKVKKIPVQWHYFTDDHDPVSDLGTITFYDSREKNPERTEWRLYYSGDFLRRAGVGDLLILAKSEVENTLFALVFDKYSSWIGIASLLFDLPVEFPDKFGFVDASYLVSTNLEFTKRNLLIELGLDSFIPPVRSDADLIMRKFKGKQPSTAEMSKFARDQISGDPVHHADDTLLNWLNREEELFRAWEEIEVSERLKKHFESVDDFISYSLSIQNRRKSRMGYAFENHLEALFLANNLNFSRNPVINKKRPDFIFPGENEYHDSKFDSSLLTMLGVKSSCKDRWRQILNEADRLQHKHLCTLEQGISKNQTDEMKVSRVTLVVPEPILDSYNPGQRLEILRISDFISLVRRKQQSL